MARPDEVLADARSAAAPRGAPAVEQSVPGCFARVAGAVPTAVAISVGPTRLTYADLHRRAAGVAAAIAAREPDGGDAIAVTAGDPVARIIALLGVWQTGRASVVLDPADPERRVTAILRDAGVTLLLADAEARGDPGLPVLRLSEVGEVDPGAGRPVPADRALALVYTSGSTGVPTWAATRSSRRRS